MRNQLKMMPLRPARIALLIASLFPFSVGASSVRVDFVTGPVSAINAAGVARPLERGAELTSGDVVRTGSGRAQLRFSDGALVSLQPDTDYRIDDYRYSGQADGQEKGFFSLLKGGLRTITGWVGRVNRETYRVTTSVATIGIRGTEFTARLSPAGDELHVGTGEGAVEVCGAGGCLVLSAGESGIVRGDSAPERTDFPPALSVVPAPGSTLPVYSWVEARDEQGKPDRQLITAAGALSPITPTTPTYPTPSGVGSVIGIVGISGAQTRDSATLTLNADGSLNSFVKSGLTTSQGTATMADYGGDSIIGWGRWANGTVTIDNVATALGANQGLHHFWGVPTPTMPTTGTATYTLLGSTKPTEITGAWAPGTFNSASLSVNFATGVVSSSLNLYINPGPNNNYVVSGTGSIGGNGFSITGMSGTGSGCASGCSGDVSGRFFGTTAERAGLTYKINEFATSRTIIGTATFKQ